MQEIEMKLQLKEPEEWNSLNDFVGQLGDVSTKQEIQMAAYYFDTAEEDLRKVKMAYRIRRENERLVATLKGGGIVQDGLHQQQEWSVEVTDMQPDLGVFLYSDIDEKLLQQIREKEFVEIVRTEFLRKSVELQWNDSRIEIALDRGWIFSGDSKTPILEIELEIKSGDVQDVVALGEFFAARFSVTKEGKSKFLRGILLRETSI